MSVVFRAGECLDVFGGEPDASFDAFVCDWPAGVSFMSRGWDTDKGGRAKWIAYWAERAAMMKRKAKRGAYALVWALPRTSHWTATALEDGGWFVQDAVTHVFGQGWPKGRAALKPASEHWILARNGGGGALQIDAARVARGERPEMVRTGTILQSNALSGASTGGTPSGNMTTLGSWPPNFALSHCSECEERGTRTVRGSTGGKIGGDLLGLMNDDGWKPDRLPIARHGLNADGTESVPAFDCLASCPCGATVLAASGGEPQRCACGSAMEWACPVAEMDRQSGDLHPPGNVGATMRGVGYGSNAVGARRMAREKDYGGASRFFPRFTYAAKSASAERHAGCDDLLWRADKRSPFGFVRVSRAEWDALPKVDMETAGEGRDKMPALKGRIGTGAAGNVHPTVKSLALMEWLVALVTPKGGRLGDITCGSGGTGIALHRLNVTRDLGASFLGCDVCPEAVDIAEARLRWWREHTAQQRGLFGEHDAIVVKPERPAKVRAAKAEPKTEAAHPRQGGLF